MKSKEFSVGSRILSSPRLMVDGHLAKDSDYSVNLTPMSEGVDRIAIDVRSLPGQAARLALRFDYLPRRPELWAATRDSFHWLPNLKLAADHFSPDHVFRSPAAILTHPTETGVAIVPDLDVLRRCRPAPQYLDLGWDKATGPWMEIGFSQYRTEGHVYYALSGEPFALSEGTQLAAYVLFGSVADFPGCVTRFLWNTFARPYTSSAMPIVMPLAKYAEYGFTPALEHLWRPGPISGTGGITLTTYRKPDGTWSGRRSADDVWFHSWFNNARTAWGLGHWGRLLDRPLWRQRAEQIMQLCVSAPQERGIFPAIYAPTLGGWEGSGNESGGPEVYHLPDAGWTGIWLRKFHAELQPIATADRRLADLAEFFISVQHPDGGFPTYVRRGTLEIVPELDGAACGAMAIWFLGEELLAGAVPSVRRSSYLNAISSGIRYLRQHVIPSLRFEDFELYTSCSKKPYGFFDPYTRLPGINTLALQWCAEAFRVACLVESGDDNDVLTGRFCLDLMCLFQQVWAPPYLSFYAFGGFGVMNTDAEWHDARQAQLAETLLNWAEFTGISEYRQRAIAATRASLALMVCEEHQGVCPQNFRGIDLHFEVQGMMAENYGHEGQDRRSYQSGFHWGTGSALTTIARFIHRDAENELASPEPDSFFNSL